MAVDMSFLAAGPDQYEPWDSGDPGSRYDAGPMPAGWVRRDSGAWTSWEHGACVLPGQGWKVHVSSSLENAQSVLAVVVAACVEAGVAFKHLAGRRMFLLAHDKHAQRVQSGKFCTLYPPTEKCAARLLERLESDLSGISGPYVLSDRRFGASECVSYRYGAFRGRVRVNAEGERVHILVGPDGADVDDERLPEFRPPPGIADPFRQDVPKTSDGSVTFNGYTFEDVIRHGNAGGAYRFRSRDGERVFVKEARAHNGYVADGSDAKARLNAEYLALRAIHARDPGLCPRPVELFHHWEHSYLVTAWTPGMSVYRWMLANNPAILVGPNAADFAEYHRRALAVLDRIEALLDRLHALGHVFVDVSPNNVLVDEDDEVRLIDFESVQPIAGVRRIMGTPGYQPPDALAVVDRDPTELDRYGLAALAHMLLFPTHEAVGRHPALLDHLHADLAELAPVAPRLWQWAARCHDRAEEGDGLPTPRAVREDTVAELRRLADRTADALEAMAEPDHPVRVYPTTPLGYRTDTRAAAAGTAGVLYALHRAGRTCDPGIVGRLRDDALAAARKSAPGLLYGSAGVAHVLAELGEGEAAETLLTTAADHPLNRTSATLGGGAAGTALGLLAHHRRTGEQRWLDLAQRLLDGVPDGDELTAAAEPGQPVRAGRWPYGRGAGAPRALPPYEGAGRLRPRHAAAPRGPGVRRVHPGGRSGLPCLTHRHPRPPVPVRRQRRVRRRALPLPRGPPGRGVRPGRRPARGRSAGRLPARLLDPLHRVPRPVPRSGGARRDPRRLRAPAGPPRPRRHRAHQRPRPVPVRDPAQGRRGLARGAGTAPVGRPVVRVGRNPARPAAPDRRGLRRLPRRVEGRRCPSSGGREESTWRRFFVCRPPRRQVLNSPASSSAPAASPSSAETSSGPTACRVHRARQAPPRLMRDPPSPRHRR